MTEQTHPQPKGRRKFPFLAVLGALLLAVSVCGLYFSVPDLLQYSILTEDSSDEILSEPVLPAAGQGDTGSGASSSVKKALAHYAELTDPALWAGENIPMTLHGAVSGLTVNRKDGNTSQSGVTVYLAGPRYAEVFPREIIEGAFLSPLEISRSSPSAVLDSSLAFRLFGDISPVGKKIQLNDNSFTVVGVAAGGRSFGSADACALWVPLGSFSGAPEILTVSAMPASGGDSLTTLWKSKAREYFGSGTFRYLAHEKTGASLLPRLLVLFLSVLLLKKWFMLLRRLGTAFRAEARERISHSYPGRLIGYFALRILAALALAAVTLAAFRGLALLAVEPLTAFPDWVPENPAALSSYLSRFWSLVAANAAPVRLVTEQAAVISFWAFLIRLGTFLFLLGLLSWFLKRRRIEA